MASGSGPNSCARWAGLVRKISSGDEQAIEELYAILSGFVRLTLAQAIGQQSLDDAVHEILLIVLKAILTGELRDPARLMGFVKTVARRHALAHIRSAAFRRRRFAPGVEHLFAPLDDSPDTRLNRFERLERARKALRRLDARDREILERFYLAGEPRQQICEEMQLSETQFRLRKSRAIAKCSWFAGISRPARSVSRIA